MFTRLLAVPTLPREDAMTATTPRRRTRGEVLGELRTLVSLQRDARAQLASVRAAINSKRHEIGELEGFEYQLVCVIDARARKIDKVLDEMGPVDR